MLEGPAPQTVASPLHLAPSLSILWWLRFFFSLRLPGVRPSSRAGTVARAHVGNPVEGERDSVLKLNTIPLVIPNSIPV